MAQEHVGLEVADPEAYRSKLRSLLGDRDRIETLAETPRTLRGIVGEHSVATLRTRPFEGKWTPNEIIGHLLDVEWTFGYRARTILCDESPRILSMNQNDWVRVQEHNEREPQVLVEDFATLRNINVAFWRRLAPEQLQRTGEHTERGPESLDTMLTMEAGHDLSHVEQIRRYLTAILG